MLKHVATMSRYARLDVIAKHAQKRGNTTVGAEVFYLSASVTAFEVHTTWVGK